MSITSIDNFYRVLDWWDMPWGKTEKVVQIGMFDEDIDRITYTIPRPPDDVTKILNWDKPKADQMWQRHEVPAFWKESYLMEQAEQRGFMVKDPKGKSIPDPDWYHDDTKHDPEQFEYYNREWDRRLKGIWLFINGKATYITGRMYYWLQHWYLDGIAPMYRDRDLYWFYAVEAAFVSPICFGMIFPKGRRSGDTTKVACIGTELVTRTLSGHYGIQAQGGTESKKTFTGKVVPGWKRLIPFFRPINSSGTSPTTEIVMQAPSRRGISKVGAAKAAESELDSWITYAPSGKKGDYPFDGEKLHIFHKDEAGKDTMQNILDLWEVIRPCLILQRGRGKAFFPSSFEETDNELTLNFKTLFEQSLLSNSIDKSATESGMFGLFLPCYVGHNEFWFTGKFGESIIHKPTEDQLEWLLQNIPLNPEDENEVARFREIYEQGGAYEYEVRQRLIKNNNPDYCRKNPFNIHEVFVPTNPDNELDTEKIDAVRRKLEMAYASDYDESISYLEHLTIRGNLEWKEGMFLGEVQFEPNPKGRFLWNKRYLPGEELANKLGIIANNVQFGDIPSTRYVSRVIRPRSEVSWIKIGYDPNKIEKKNKVSGRSSKASFYGFYPYNPLHDPMWDRNIIQKPGFSDDWVTNAFVFEYFRMPKTPREADEDALKACIFLNAKILFERQIPRFGDWMGQIGCGSFLIKDKAFVANPKGGVGVPGVHMSTELHEMIYRRHEQYINEHLTAEKCPLPTLLNQLYSFDPEKITMLDAYVGGGLGLLASQPKEVRKDPRVMLNGMNQAVNKNATAKDFIQNSFGVYTGRRVC